MNRFYDAQYVALILWKQKNIVYLVIRVIKIWYNNIANENFIIFIKFNYALDFWMQNTID